MAKSLSPKRKKSAPSATSLKNNPAKSKSSSPTAVSVADRKKKKKKASADASIELDYSGPTTPKKKIKVKEMQTLPSRGRSNKKKKSSDVSIASDCSGPTTPKKKSKAEKVQLLPSRGRSGKSNRSSGHGKYRDPASPSNTTVTTIKGGMTPSPMATTSPNRSKVTRTSSPVRKKLSTMHLNETTFPTSKKTSAPNSAEDSPKEKGTKPLVNQIDWLSKQEVMDALSYFFDKREYNEITKVKRFELLCGCYTPTKVRPVYFIHSVDAGIARRDIDLTCCSSRKKKRGKPCRNLSQKP